MDDTPQVPAGLIWYPDARPGIARARSGTGFRYILPDGTTLARGPERTRIETLAVPPAWEEVWLSPRANGHLQATGKDVRQRKQYRYHADWSAARSETKFDGLAAFGRALSKLRARVKRDLAAEAGDMDFALAAAVALIDRLALRVGGAAYERDNGSYGVTTLRRRHMRLSDGGIRLSFTAKGGKRVRRQIADRTLSRILHKAADLPGAQLLTWLDDHGTVHRLGSGEVNGWLAGAADVPGVTAKTFRTWAGTLAAFAVAEAGGATIKAMAAAAAEHLGNTPTVARTSYIHPRVIALAGAEAPSIEGGTVAGLRIGEARLLRFLEDS